jgi:formate dehydrogenase assembly factor FdhD
MLAVFALAVVLLAAAATQAQDIRGLEVCTAEKDMARRTSCLQANAEFLQQELTKQTRKSQADQAAADRDIAALKADIAALKAALAKTQGVLTEMKKGKPAEKK